MGVVIVPFGTFPDLWRQCGGSPPAIAHGLLAVNPDTRVEHTPFEHNAICDFLKSKYPDWTDDELYGKARLINAALMAKMQDVFEFLDDSEVLGGIVGSNADHHGAPYSLTEEFIAVYRMHPLMPDDFTFRSVSTGEVLEQRTLPEIAGRASRD